LAQHLDGTAAVAYFPAGSLIGEDLPVCAAIDIRPGTDGPPPDRRGDPVRELPLTRDGTQRAIMGLA